MWGSGKFAHPAPMQHIAVLGLSLLVQVQAPAATAPAAPAAAVTPPATTEVVPVVETVPAVTEAPAPAAKKSLLPPKSKPRLLVMDIVDKGAGGEIANAVSQSIQGQAIASHVGETITVTQIQLLLDAQATQQLVGCDAEACMTQIGNLVEADIILGGNVAKVGDDVVITLLTVDPRDGRRIKQEQRKTPVSRDLYYYASKQLASMVLTGKAADPRVPVIINIVDGGTPVEGTVIVDGKDMGLATTKQLELDPGSHEVVVKRSGFADWRTLVDVQEGAPQQVTATLVGERLYLWPVALVTGVAAVATGAVSLIMLDAANAEFSGQGVLFKSDKGGYSTVSPTDSADLCAREQSIWFNAGRNPGKGEALFAANTCGVVAGPGVGGWLGITSIALSTATVGLVVGDFVIGAVSE